MKMTITDVPYHDQSSTLRMFARNLGYKGVAITVQPESFRQDTEGLLLTLEGPATEVVEAMEALGYEL